MNVALLIRDPVEQPGSRLRALQWIPHLKARGAAVRVLPWTVRSRTDVARYSTTALRLARWADVSVLFKPCQAPRLVNLIRRVSRRMLVDFDDAVWAPSPGSPTEPWHQGLRQRLVHAVRSADEVLVGSHQLAEWCSEVAGGVPSTWMPTCIDLGDYPTVKEVRDQRPLVIGWIGASVNLPDLHPLRPVLGELIDRGLASLTVVCDRPLELDGVPSRFVPWSLERERRDLLEMDIGVMPLHDSERARGRCGFKAIQYMASGLPVIASPVPGPSEVVTDGTTGLLANDEDAWRRHLWTVASDTALRRSLGTAGRADAERRYSVQANLDRLVSSLSGTS